MRGLDDAVLRLARFGLAVALLATLAGASAASAAAPGSRLVERHPIAAETSLAGTPCTISGETALDWAGDELSIALWIEPFPPASAKADETKARDLARTLVRGELDRAVKELLSRQSFDLKTLTASPPGKPSVYARFLDSQSQSIRFERRSQGGWQAALAIPFFGRGGLAEFFLSAGMDVFRGTVTPGGGTTGRGTTIGGGTTGDGTGGTGTGSSPPGGGGAAAVPAGTERLVDQASALCTAAAGARVSVGGATVEIPPGALAGDANLVLSQYALAVPSAQVDGGALSGQSPLSDSGFALSLAAQSTSLAGPIEVRLPVDAARLPAGTPPERIQVSALIAGFMVPQGPAERYDAAAGTLTVTLRPRRRIARAEPPAGTWPVLGAGLPFAGLLGKVTLSGTATAAFTGVAVGLLAGYPLLATVDDFRAVAVYSSYETAHFKVRYRVADSAEGTIARIGDALELGYRLFVETMGFSLPNFVDLDGHYCVYVDAFANHASLDLLGAKDASGFTLPGSTLFEGACYVNASKPPAEWAETAVHEYFHAVQYGPLSDLAPNMLRTFLYPESNWLFEGSATALSGRVVVGAGARPARATGFTNHLAQKRPLFDPEQDPAADVAQDLFYFLEKRTQGVDFYLPMFKALGIEFGSPQPQAVAAADRAIRERDPSASSSLDQVWREFVKDLTFTHPGDYAGAPPPADQGEVREGALATHTVELPELSYAIVHDKVGALDPAKPDPTEPQDVKVTITVLSAAEHAAAEVTVGAIKTMAPDETPQTVLLRPNETRVVKLRSFRKDVTRVLQVVAVNPTSLRDQKIELEIRTELEKLADAGVHVAYESSNAGAGMQGVRVMEVQTAQAWDAGLRSLRAVSQSGAVLAHDKDGRVVVRNQWGRGAVNDLTACNSTASKNEGDVTDDGRLYLAGTYKVRDEQNAEQTINGIVSCLSDGSGLVRVPIDLDGDLKAGPADGFMVYSDLVVAKGGRTLAFGIWKDGKQWLASADSSGLAGIRWLTPRYSEDLAISGDGERVTFEMGQEDDRHVAVMPTGGGEPIDLNRASGVELRGNGVSISPDGNTLAAVYLSTSTRDAGLAFLNAATGALEGKVSTLPMMPDGDAPQFTPDGRYVVFAGADPGKVPVSLELYMMGRDGSELRNLTQTPGVVERAPLVR